MIPITVRASSLPEWGDCERRAAAKMFHRLVGNMGFELRGLGGHIGAHVGTGAHAAAELTLRSKMVQGEAVKAGEAIECGITAFRSSLEQDDCPTWDDVTDNRNVAEKQIAQITHSYRHHVVPHLRPVRLEFSMQAKFSDHLTLTGHADVIDMSGVRDLKTGKSAGKNCAQLGAYNLLARSSGFEVGNPAEDHIPRTAPGAPAGAWTRFTYPAMGAERAIHRTLSRIELAVQDFIATGEPQAFQANPASMLCTDRFCPARTTRFCQEHKGASL